MTEQEWLQCNDGNAMLAYLKGKSLATPRKLCLFICASLRRFFADQPPILELVEAAEQFVEVTPTIEERRAALAKFEKLQDVRTPILDLRAVRMNLVRNSLTESLVDHGALMMWWHHANAAALGSKEEPEVALRSAALLRDLFLTPLVRRLPRIPPGWRRSESTIFQVSQAIYADRAFDRMPILGDALEDAGCTSVDILSHCRSGTEHTRGCWLADLILGKK